MNSIDNVLARIQEIISRIHEIQATDGRVSGYGPGTAPGGPSAQTGSVAKGNAAAQAAGTTPTAARAKNQDFQQLLQGVLAAEGSTLSSGTGAANGLLSGLGSLGNLGSPGSLNDLGAVLGTGSPSTGSASNTSALAQYRSELLQALRDLAAQKNKPAHPAS